MMFVCSAGQPRRVHAAENKKADVAERPKRSATSAFLFSAAWTRRGRRQTRRVHAAENKKADVAERFWSIPATSALFRGVDPSRSKKADVAEHPEAFLHVGLLIDGPPGAAGLPFFKSSDDFASIV